MSIAPDVARQYLKAMGIESWESRSVEVAVAQSSDSTPATAQWQGATQYDPGSFVSHLAQATVAESTLSPTQILVVLEAPALESESQTLLASMLKAINVDLAQQTVVNLQSAGSETVESVAGTVKPKIILLMAQLQNDLSELAVLRDGPFKAPWTTASIALTLHPAVLLNQPDLKRPAWEDLKRVKAVLGG